MFIRQGDLVLVKVDEMPKPDILNQGLFWEESEEKKFSLRGETGNVHEVIGIKEMMVPIHPPEDLKVVAVVTLDDGGEIIHTGNGETHPDMKIPDGTYEVHRGKEHENPAGVD